MNPRCTATNEAGAPCESRPRRGDTLCFWHDPEHAAEAAEARRLGGLRRRREHTLQGAYDFEGLESVSQIRRLLEVAVVDVLGLDNTIPRARTLGSLAQTAARLLEVGELEDRVDTIERALGERLSKGKSSR